MQMKQDISLDLQLDKALEIKNFLERRAAVVSLINQGAHLTPPLLEEALKTYDYMVIKSVLAYAQKIGLKPTTECLNIMITNRAAVTERAYDAMMRGSAVDPSYSIYAIQAKTVQSLIKLGALVTPELVKASAMDDKKFGDYRIGIALAGANVESTSMALQKEFDRISEIRKNSRVLAQASRTGTSLFHTLPEELLHRVASLMGKNNEVIEENQADIETAANVFSKP